MVIRRWTDDQLVAAVDNSRTNLELMRALGLSPRGGSSVAHVHKVIRRLGLSTAHFKKGGMPKGTYRTTPVEFLEKLVQNGNYSGNDRIRKGLIAREIKEERCEKCGLTEWLGQRAPLELDHKNGNRNDYRVENLQILCANCHALKTRGDLKDRSAAHGGYRIERKCPTCGKDMSWRSSHCKPCASKIIHKEKIAWPTLLVLLAAKRGRKIRTLSKELGVSDTAIRKRIKTLTQAPEGKVEEPTDCNPVLSRFDDGPALQILNEEGTGGMVCHQS